MLDMRAVLSSLGLVLVCALAGSQAATTGTYESVI